MRKSKWITGLFLGGLYLTTLATLIKPDDVFSSKEKRYLAQKPEFSVERLLSGDYGRDYETYLNDQFPMREQIAALHTGCERLLGKSEISGVYFGKFDYFIEHHQKSDYETELAAKNETAVFEFLQEMSGRLGNDRVRFLPAPSAETVLTDYLPEGAPSAAENKVFARYQSRAEKLSEKEVLVSLQEVLKKAQHESEKEIYYRTDHHWTMNGAFAAYTAWADSMGIIPKQKDDFTEEKLKEDFYGTVAARVNTEVLPDTLLAFLPKFPVEYAIEYQGEKTLADSLYEKKMLDGPEPYAVYLKGNQAFTRITTKGTPEEMSNRKLLVVKDSFGNSIVPFLVNHYPETLVVDLRYYKPGLAEMMEEEGVTDICVVMNPAQMSKETNLYKINR